VVDTVYNIVEIVWLFCDVWKCFFGQGVLFKAI